MMSLKITAQRESFVPVPINKFAVMQSHNEGKGSKFSNVSDESTLLPMTNFLYSLSLLSQHNTTEQQIDTKTHKSE